LIVSSSFKLVQTDDNTNAHIKATFIYNFTKYIEWPAASKKGNFIIGVLGNTPLFSELINMKQTTTRGNQPFEISKFSSVGAITQCHMLFIAKVKSGEIANVIAKMKGKNTLIISEKDGLIQKGSGINFVVKNNKQGFELNKGSIKSQGLSVSSNLIAFATLVI